MLSGRKIVPTSGRPVHLVDTSTLVKKVQIFSLPANTGLIWIAFSDDGFASANSQQGLWIDDSRSFVCDNIDLTTIRIDAAISGEGVTWLATPK
jgi:hypothetical protein